MTGRWRFISDHRDLYGVRRLCRVLSVSASGFCRWIAAAPARAARRAAEDDLASTIEEIHDESNGAYGVPRITRELRERHGPVNHKRVARLMRERGIAGRHLRRTVRTTVADRRVPPAPDLVGRVFAAAAPDVRWCGDITYLPVGGAWMYLATVIDMHSRRVVGWSLAEHMRADLVVDAVRAAVDARGGDVRGVVFHWLNLVSTRPRRSPRSAGRTGFGARWAGSAPATTTPSPSRSSPLSSANCSTVHAG